MAKLQWDATGERFFETGVEKGVLYPSNGTGGYAKGVPWNGLTAVTASPSGAESSPLWADNKKYANLVSAEQFGATIEAYMYPDEFGECDGSAEIAPGISIGQQARKPFGFSYVTKIGNDVDPEVGYKINLVYGCMAKPSERANKSVNDSPEANTMSWELSTTPIEVAGFKPTATLEIDSTKVSAQDLAALEELLYGTVDDEPTLPTPDEVVALVGTVVG